jgi:hypothetical protein
MQVIREPSKEYFGRIVFIFGFTLLAIILGRYIASGAYFYFLILLITATVLILFHKLLEVFIILVLLINHEFFYLTPQLGTAYKDYQYQGLLYFILLITGGWYFIKRKENHEENFNKIVIALLLVVLIGIFNSYFQGQPIISGLSAARGYFLILFYFVFMSKNIDSRKLFNFLITVGFFLSVINNIQYIFFEEIDIFSVSRGIERAGQLRFMQGGFFVIFSSLIAFGEYIRTQKKAYLVVSVYMVSTVVIQGQTRVIYGGLIITMMFILILAKKINFARAVLIGGPVFSLIILLSPIIKSTFLGNLYGMTKYEITEQEGGVRIRLEAYDYYFREIKESPIIGKGIWDPGFSGYNPEKTKDQYIHLGDIGITSLLFRFGVIGVIWLIFLFVRVYKLSFFSLGRLKEKVHFGLIGYFIFCISIMVTINRITHHRSIIYLALVLALLSQMNYTKQEDLDE